MHGFKRAAGGPVGPATMAEGVGQVLQGLIRGKRASQAPSERRVRFDDEQAPAALASQLHQTLEQIGGPMDSLTLVCIGTDRSTGDAFGPLVGTELDKRGLPGIRVYGTLRDPVHAANLEERLAVIGEQARGSAVIAIDACLGLSQNVGTFSVRPGPVQPGTGVNKKLPAVGDMHLVGVVNVGGFMEYFVLQNTRLSLVMQMAHAVAEAFALLAERVTPYVVSAATSAEQGFAPKS